MESLSKKLHVICEKLTLNDFEHKWEAGRRWYKILFSSRESQQMQRLTSRNEGHSSLLVRFAPELIWKSVVNAKNSTTERLDIHNVAQEVEGN